MKTLRYKISIVLLFIGIITVSAQKLEKKHTEKFIVDKDVVIDINTKYTDIEIETWNKNEVVVEAYIDVKDESDQKIIDDYLKKWNFEALGNKSRINIRSKNSGLIDIHAFDFNSPNYDVLIRESLNNASENFTFVLPELPEMPELAELPEMLIEIPEIMELTELARLPTKFDFDSYKKDKKYLEKWKKKNKDILNGADVKIGKNSISIKTDRDDISKEELEKRLESLEARRKEHQERIEKEMKKRQLKMKERIAKQQERIEVQQKELQSRIKERDKERKLELIERQEARAKRAKEMAQRRIEVRDILDKREKVKIKRVIKIKAPKDAKFNMNVSYGTVSFPK